MEIKKILQRLLEFYNSTRRIGHTKILDFAVVEHDINIVTLKDDHKNDFHKQNRNKIIPLDNLNELVDNKKPTFIDNGALCYLLQESLERIKELEKENQRKQSLLEHINDLTT